jgi:magnesium-transporting ATPase (P-type)
VNYLFSGTLINNGTATGVVVSTGMRTQIGIIQQQVTNTSKVLGSRSWQGEG